jgi:putative FmdB family regulatory protein
MPLYEYVCNRCARQFEALLFGKERAACPDCGGRDLERMLSTFAAHGEGSADRAGDTAPGGGCGSCGDPRGPGSCGLN